MNNIYGLIDPRRSDWVMYIGKGSSERPRQHWRGFLRDGWAVNGALRRWFQQLQADGVEPDFIFLEENVSNWQEAERAWIWSWRRVNSQLCNVSAGGNDWPEESKKLGGYNLKKLHPEIAKQAGAKGAQVSGGWKKIRQLYPELAKKASQKGGYRLKELHPNLARECGLNPNSQAALVKSRTSEHQKKAALSARHNQWHVRRGIMNLKDCRLCQEEYAFRSDFGC